MSRELGPDAADLYDRQLLLFGVKRDAELDLPEVLRYGIDSYGDPEHVSVYGMRPADWYGCGIRLLGRTAVECTGDALAEAIAADVAAVASSAPARSGALVVDPFAGSGNTLYWLQRHLPGSSGAGFELDAGVFRRTKENLAILRAPVEVLNVDYAAGLAEVVAPADQLVVAFVAPPWGDALHPVEGLDLRRTKPPVARIVDALVGVFPRNPMLIAVQVFEKVEPDSVSELQRRWAWSAVHHYDLDEVGRNHGVLLGTRGWVPR